MIGYLTTPLPCTEQDIQVSLNELLTYDNQDFVNIHDSHKISTLLFENTVPTFYEKGDETYTPLSSDNDCAVTVTVRKMMATFVQPKLCNTCKVDMITRKEEIVGSGISITWSCDFGHVRSTWYSQPRLRLGVYLGDLCLSAACFSNFWKSR